jgi:CubicO group peptidase (beta-lactamase class C family)
VKLKILAIGVIVLISNEVFVSVVSSEHDDNSIEAKYDNLESVNVRVALLSYQQKSITNDKNFDSEMKLLMRLCYSPSLTACIIKDNKIAWAKSYGFSDVYKFKRAAIDDIYPVGSVTKAITATALLQLYDKGVFDLDDDVSQYLPFSLRNPKYPDVNITFRMLLSHRASLYDYCIYEKKVMHQTILFSDIFNDLGSWLKEALLPGGQFYKSQYWYDYKPGTKATYSNVGFMLIGYLVEKLSGMSIEEYCQENIFKPLNMMNTSYHPQNLDKEKMVTPYLKKAGIYIPLPKYDAKSLAVIGGVRTTLEDLSHFLIAHMNNGVYNGFRLLNESTVELMHNCIYPEAVNHRYLAKNRKYGLGWFDADQFGEIVSGHGGMCPGGVCFMMMSKSSGIGFIFFTNQFNFYGVFEDIRFAVHVRARFLIGRALLQKAEEI